MKQVYKWMLIFGIALSVCSLPAISQAYRCEWRNGHKVCWHNGERRCYWVNGHWHHGVYFKGHKVCRY